ncbi:lytic transglycosylase domain-containing protein [Paraburkholderia sp. J67]|uniref:lytic transglycosylase domain-containing protein n=1 Tax=Paraburkholderia sp. J67 TaxID=2805435 RepID=UPI0039F62263
MAVVEINDTRHAIYCNTSDSVDIGFMQINSIHLPELYRQGIRCKDLLNACKNIYTAASLIRRNMNAHQRFWETVGKYHSATPKFYLHYLQLVRTELHRE